MERAYLPAHHRRAARPQARPSPPAAGGQGAQATAFKHARGRTRTPEHAQSQQQGQEAAAQGTPARAPPRGQRGRPRAAATEQKRARRAGSGGRAGAPLAAPNGWQPLRERRQERSAREHRTTKHPSREHAVGRFGSFVDEVAGTLGFGVVRYIPGHPGRFPVQPVEDIQ